VSLVGLHYAVAETRFSSYFGFYLYIDKSVSRETMAVDQQDAVGLL